MFVFRELLLTVAWLIEYVLWAYMWIIIIRALVSWVNPDPWNPIVQFLYRITEPVLGPIRRRLPTGQTGIDFSPIIVILAIMFLQRFLVPVLVQAAYRLS
jgi:YggT family protein